MQKIAILYDAGQAVLSTFDLDEVLQRILVIARDYFHLQNVAIVFLDKKSGELCTRSQIGGEPGTKTFAYRLGRPDRRGAQKKRPIYSLMLRKKPRYLPLGK